MQTCFLMKTVAFYKKIPLSYKKLPFLIKKHTWPTYKKTQPLISPFIKKLIFQKNRDPCCTTVTPKGRHQSQKHTSIRALPELHKPPPHPPIRATLPTFSGRQKRRFARMAEKNTDDDNNCCHDNDHYSCNSVNF